MILKKFKKVCAFLTEMLFQKNFFESKNKDMEGKLLKKSPSKPPFKTF